MEKSYEDKKYCIFLVKWQY